MTLIVIGCPDHSWWNNMILQTRDEQERRTFIIVKVDLDRLVRIERGELHKTFS
jgi:hypothetical protein